MTRYANRGGYSNVFSYEIGKDYIDVVFNGGAAYRYSLASVGASNLQTMIELAQAGEGLNSFINRNVKKLYEARL
ncbi:hypothetical protein SM764_07460 [Pseudophaeobacter sp. 1A16562]|uniref:hypothetical protein n=1 Tax=Pseudophaeobacter sp. 1A16562 TaxID=3098143 RepID=UPI0034D60A2E